MSLGIKFILPIERSCVHGLKAFHRLFFGMNLSPVQHDGKKTCENRNIATSRCSGSRAKRRELTQHIAYRRYCNTDHNVGRVRSVVSLSQFFTSSEEKSSQLTKSAKLSQKLLSQQVSLLNEKRKSPKCHCWVKSNSLSALLRRRTPELTFKQRRRLTTDVLPEQIQRLITTKLLSSITRLIPMYAVWS